MGFCRRCGDIVHEALCKCGGTAVSGVVPFNPDKPKTPSPDRWSQTYTRSESPRKASHTCNLVQSVQQQRIEAHTTGDYAPVRRVTALSTIGVYKTCLAPIARTPSPLKQSAVFDEDEDEDEEEGEGLDRSASPSPSTDTALTKVFGTILQSPRSLSKYSCAICKESFVPDSVIYPAPSLSAEPDQYLCRPCFVLNGGSKGDCATCDKPVLSLTEEGGFVKHTGKYWHKECFRCRGCFKNLSDDPMVDLLGVPCCIACFDGGEVRVNTLGQAAAQTVDKQTPSPESELSQSLPPKPTPKATTPRRPSSSSRMSPAQTPPTASKGLSFSSPSTPSRSMSRRSSGRRVSHKGPHAGNAPADENQPDQDRKGGKLPPVEIGKEPVSGKAKVLIERDVFGPVENKSRPSLASNECLPLRSSSPERASKLRFGTSTSCPGCHVTVSTMERGVVQGPQGTRWHAACLVCGGKNRTNTSNGCGKKLDSAAKADKEGNICCRDCLNKLPRDLRPSPQVSPIRTTFMTSTHTGSIANVSSSFKLPETTLEKQMTGQLPRQYTGGDFSPTRQLSRSPRKAQGVFLNSLNEVDHIQTATPPPVARHMTGNIAKLTLQLTGNVARNWQSPSNTAARPFSPQSGAFPIRSLTGTIQHRPATPSTPSMLGSLDEGDEPAEPQLVQEIRTAPHQTTVGSSNSVQCSPVVGPPSPTKRSLKLPRPRPKSVLGMRHGTSKSMDMSGGRGMFLVRQMTGNGRIET